MRRIALGAAALIILATVGAGLGQKNRPVQLVASTEPLSPEEERKAFHLPPGFEVELVASEPAIRKPLNIAFDDRGRLWVTDTIEYPYPAPPDRKPRDSVKVLEDTDGDGKADKVTTFADSLNIPIGVLPITGGAIVHGIPNIHRLLDTDGDGVADRREVLYGTYGSNDTHGMTNSFSWGFDGWIYACHGFANTSTIKAADGSSITLNSGNTYRFRADGSRIEQHTWGQVNPFGLTFDPLGNLFSADCHTRPIMMLLRGGWYPSFGKPHDGLGFAPEICQHDHGSTGIAGIVHYSAEQFPKEFRDNLFVGNPVTGRINRDRLERHGSTLRAVQLPDFLISDDPWFRPVDIKLGPDGALYVADFYNRIIGHYEVPLTHPGRDRDRGRIWRIFWRGEDGKARPKPPRADWSKASVTELAGDLAHPNLAVRIRAANHLVERGGKPGIEAVRRAMTPESSAFQRAHGLWVLDRLVALDETTLDAACRDREALVRVHAMRVLSERKTLSPRLHRLLIAGLQDDDAFVQRAAADALGMHPEAANIRPLLEARQRVPAADVQLLHTVRMALRNQLRPLAHWAGIPSRELSKAEAHAVADVALGIPSPEAAAFLLQCLQTHGTLPDPTRGVQHIARHGTPDVQQAIVALARNERPTDLRHQAAVLRAIQQGTQERGGKLTEETRKWADGLAHRLLASNDGSLVTQGIELAGAFQLSSLADPLADLAARKDLPEPQRRAAITSLVTIRPVTSIGPLGRILNDAAEPLALRDHAANTLGGINQPASREALLSALQAAPARLQNVIAANLARTPQGAEKLLETITAGKASARLLQERAVETRLNEAQLPDIKNRIAMLTRGLPPADLRMQELLRRRQLAYASAKVDLAVGAKIFEKNCAICHQLGGKGAKVGPQLDGIGLRGLDRLLEDLFDPNRNVDQAFRSTTITLKNGQIVSGLVLREEGQVVVVADQQGKEVRVTKGMIEDRLVTPLSSMPANLVDQVPEADFPHLLAYLLSQRPPR